MNLVQVGGFLQALTGFLALLLQGLAVYHGMPLDTSHATVGTGLLVGGIAHLADGRH